MGSLFLSDEELVKKDDDHKPTKPLPIRPSWSFTRIPPRMALKRLVLTLVACIVVYIFVHNIPTDVGIRDHRHPVYSPLLNSPGQQLDPPKSIPRVGPLRAPNWGKLGSDKKKTPVSYDGPIVFNNLATSLHAISGTHGDFDKNKNILFAAASLKSAALLLPLACQMGSELRNYVHFAVMSKSDISIEELRDVNGIDDSCHIIFHDGRPDFAASSTDARFLKAVMRAMYHINYYMHPQAVIIDASGDESAFFHEGMRVQVKAMNTPLLELPEGSAPKLSYLTKLGSASLAAWHRVKIDILIHAPRGAAGNLIRLLKALTTSDFSASAVPHLTIELPNDIDSATVKFLESFQWPPAKAYNPTHTNQLTLRHRIPRTSLTEEESSARFLESFWPANDRYSHVLVLSPQVEVSPSFFHYIKYAVLEYMYSEAALLQQWDSRLLGISLDLPSTHIDASKPFRPPSGRGGIDGPEEPSSFLWQSPESHAVLFTGQKWMELHAFVSRLLDLQSSRQQSQLPVSPFFSNKLVSKRYPSWLEHVLRLSRARGYWTLYPSPRTAETLAVVHAELYKAPEEYEKEIGRKVPGSSEGVLTEGDFMDSLPSRGNLLPFDDMPLLLWDGRSTSLEDLDSVAAEYAAEFRRAVGGCESLTPSELLPRRSARDLFCVKQD